MLAQESGFGAGTAKNAQRDVLQSLFGGDYSLWISSGLNPYTHAHINADGSRSLNVRLLDGTIYSNGSLPSSFNSGHSAEAGFGENGIALTQSLISTMSNGEYLYDYSKVTPRMSIAVGVGYLAYQINRTGSEEAGVKNYGPSGYTTDINRHLRNMGASELRK